MAHLRIGAVSYLNTKPLVWELSRFLPDASLVLDLPSRLADQLQSGALDIALIPSVEYLRHADQYQIVSDACIGCCGPVWSVRLLSRVPIPEIKTLALDEGSRTSAILVQLLLAKQFNLSPKRVPLPIDADYQQTDADAVLLIGDRAMHPSTGRYHEIWDLGDRWYTLTQLPFVFAMWVGRRGSDDSHVAQGLQQCRDHGLDSVPAIARRYAAQHGLTDNDCVAYLSRYLHFTLGQNERQGLEWFRQQATQLGLLADQQTLG